MPIGSQPASGFAATRPPTPAFSRRDPRNLSSGMPSGQKWSPGRTFPQKPDELVEWWQRMHEVNATGLPPPARSVLQFVGR